MDVVVLLLTAMGIGAIIAWAWREHKRNQREYWRK